MAATDPPAHGGYGRRCDRHRSTMFTNPTENDHLMVDRHEAAYVRVEGGGGGRRTTMKWLSVAAIVGLLALIGLKASSVANDDEDTTAMLKAEDMEANYLAQFEVRRRVL